MPVYIDTALEDYALREHNILGRTAAMGNALYAIPYARLPLEALKVLQMVANGGPFLYPAKDGTIFQNHFGDLPRGQYLEFTVPTPGVNGRGQCRLVVRHNGIPFFTTCHYERVQGKMTPDERRAATAQVDEQWRNGFHVITGIPMDLYGKIAVAIRAMTQLALPAP